MSTQALASPDEDPHMMLILGKPGGGKGTISGKILKVRTSIYNILEYEIWLRTLAGILKSQYNSSLQIGNCCVTNVNFIVLLNSHLKVVPFL
jgi:hypothetical protein